MLDYEAATNHNMTVRARDPLTGTHTDTQVIVTVIDVNDNPPEFRRLVFKGEVSEAAAPGHMVLQVNYLLEYYKFSSLKIFHTFDMKIWP